MLLRKYFETNDGSLPEVEIRFSLPDESQAAFELFFSRGARNVTRYGGFLWSIDTQTEMPFIGQSAAALVISGIVEPFHVVLADINSSICAIPDIGLFYEPLNLTLDYRMGSDWRESQVHSFLNLLKDLSLLGGTISVPWWGEQGQQDFASALQIK